MPCHVARRWPAVSLIIDVGPAIEAHREALATVFGVPIERVDVRESIRWDGGSPVMTLDLRLDGERAPEAWWKFTRDVIDAARTLSELKAQHARELEDLRARLAAIPWWRRALARIVGALWGSP